ncbi:MAG: GntR family transcriptional regulator [Hyphomicrobiaceae bacterium]
MDVRQRPDVPIEDPLKRGDGEANQPLYVQLAQTLGERIANGTYPVGSLLPTEAELGQAFSVSRYTVRQAIHHLRMQGLVSARKGVGTRVETQEAAPSYSQSIRSLGELLQYATQTRLEVLSVEEIGVRGKSAEAIGTRPKTPWIRVAGIRHGNDGERPDCFNEVVFDGAYQALIADKRELRTAIWSLIEQDFGETIVEVEQEIEATVLDEEMAALLKAEVGEPALKFTRRFFVTGRRLVEVTVSVHPADRFIYRMTIRRDALA